MKNILLLAMSRLSRTEERDFCLKTAVKGIKIEKAESCIGQLEPVTKLMIENTKGDLVIVMLCTDKTLLEPVPAVGNKSAVSFFMERIGRFLGDVEADKEHVFNEDTINTFFQSSADGRKIIYHAVPLEEENSLRGIREAVRLIRETYAEEKNECRFWIAANGGLRDNFLTMSAIVSLLKHNMIVPEYILSTEIDFGSPVSWIIDVSNSFRIFEFVSGINEFLESGKASILSDHFQSGENENDNLLVNAINCIAEGTALCNADTYEKGIEDLRSYFQQKPEERAEAFREQEQRIFEASVREDFAKILADDEKYYYLDIVEHCLKNNMMQQALTFVESKMAHDFFRTGLVSYACNNDTDSLINEAIQQSKQQYEEDKVHFVFDRYLRQAIQYTEHDKSRSLGHGLRHFLCMRKKYEEGLKMLDDRAYTKHNLNHNYNDNDRHFQRPRFNLSRAVTFSNERYRNGGTVGSIDIHCILLSSVDDLNQNDERERFEKYRLAFERVLYMHSILKKCRNMLNHGNASEQESIQRVHLIIDDRQKTFAEGVRNVLELYCKYSRKIFEYADTLNT